MTVLMDMPLSVISCLIANYLCGLKDIVSYSQPDLNLHMLHFMSLQFLCVLVLLEITRFQPFCQSKK